MLRIERAGSSRSLAFAQSVQAALLEAAHPALHRGPVLTEQIGDFAARLTGGHEQQPVQAMVVARLLASPDLLLNGDSHYLSILDLQLAHRPSPRE